MRASIGNPDRDDAKPAGSSSFQEVDRADIRGKRFAATISWREKDVAFYGQRSKEGWERSLGVEQKEARSQSS